jgi:transcriptional regulator with XRE-family HTH domain
VADSKEVVQVEVVVAQRVRELRKRRDLTQGQLAEKVGGILGANWYATTVAKIEGAGTSRGGRKYQPRAVTLTELLALAVALEASPESLMLPRDPSAWVAIGSRELPAYVLRGWLAGRLGELPPRDEVSAILPAEFRELAEFIAQTVKVAEAQRSEYNAERGDEVRRAFTVRGVEYLEADTAELIGWLGLSDRPERQAALELVKKIEGDCQMIRSSLEGR